MATSPLNWLYWNDKSSGKIQRSGPDGTAVTDLVTGLGEIKVMQLDMTNEKLYWNDKGSGKMQRSDLDGSNVEDLVTGLGDVKVMELDLTNNKIYWNDKSSGKMQRSDLDGSSIEDLVTGLGDVLVMELDLENGKLYWGDKDSNKIQRSNLDGSDEEDLVTGLGEVKVMELDLTNNKIYWNDKSSGKMQRSNLDGSNVEDLVTGLGDVKVMELDLTDNKIYWNDKDSGKMQRSNLDGSNVEDLVIDLGDVQVMKLDLTNGKIYWNDKTSKKNQRASLDGSNVENLTMNLDDVKVMGLGGTTGLSSRGYSEARVDTGITACKIESTTVSKETGGSSNFTVSMPATRPDGDLYIAQIAIESGSSINSIPSGWTEMENEVWGGTVRFAAYYRVGSSEPASYTWGAASSKKWIGAIHHISGSDTSDPISASGVDWGNSANPDAPAVTSTDDRCLVLRLYGSAGDEQAENYWPGGTIGIFQDDASGIVVSAAAYEMQATAGNTGSAAFTMTGSKKWVTATIAVSPVPGSGIPSITIPTPADVSAGDLLIAAVATDGDTDTSLSPPGGEGWTEIAVGDYDNEVTLGAWWKNAGASESGGHKFTWSDAEGAYGWIMRFTGHDLAAPINAFVDSGATSANPTSPAVTSTARYALIVRLGAFDNNSITVDAPGLGGHTALTMDKSGSSGVGTVTYENDFEEAKRGSAGTSLTINTPAGAAQNDLLIAAVSVDSVETISPPGGEGWTQIDQGDGNGQVTFGVWWKLADASESASHQFTWSGSKQAYGWIMRFTGHDTSAPINASQVQEGGNTTTPISPSVTTTVANTMIVRIGGFDDDDITFDNPGLSGHTTITMDKSNSGGSSCSGGSGYVLQPAMGASGTDNFQLTSDEQYRCVTVAIAPAPGTGGGTVSGGAGYVAQTIAGSSGTSTFTLTGSEKSKTLTIAIAPIGPVSGGAGYVKQAISGASGTSTFLLTAPEDSRMVTVVLKPDTGG